MIWLSYLIFLCFADQRAWSTNGSEIQRRGSTVCLRAQVSLCSRVHFHLYSGLCVLVPYAGHMWHRWIRRVNKTRRRKVEGLPSYTHTHTLSLILFQLLIKSWVFAFRELSSSRNIHLICSQRTGIQTGSWECYPGSHPGILSASIIFLLKHT